MPDAKNLSAAHSADILLLTLVAGSADALGFISLGHVFTSNMTGNLVLMGISLSEGRNADTLRSLLAFLAFVLGAGLGAGICRRTSRPETLARAVTITLACEAALLMVFALGSTSFHPREQAAFAYVLIALLSGAMGLQSVAGLLLGIPGVVTTVVTGTLTSLVTGLIRSIGSTGSPQPAAPIHFGLQTLVIVAYGAGAAIGGLLIARAPLFSGFFPVTVALIVIVLRLAQRVR